MARWSAKLTLTVVEAQIVSGPQGPMPQPIQQLEFSTRAEESGVTPAAALGTVVDQLQHWTNMLTEDRKKESH